MVVICTGWPADIAALGPAAEAAHPLPAPFTLGDVVGALAGQVDHTRLILRRSSTSLRSMLYQRYAVTLVVREEGAAEETIIDEMKASKVNYTVLDLEEAEALDSDQVAKLAVVIVSVGDAPSAAPFLPLLRRLLRRNAADAQGLFVGVVGTSEEQRAEYGRHNVGAFAVVSPVSVLHILTARMDAEKSSGNTVAAASLHGSTRTPLPRRLGGSSDNLVAMGAAAEAASGDECGACGQMMQLVSSFVPPSFAKELGMDDLRGVQLGDALCRTITVFFSDIRGFTSMSERCGMVEVMAMVNTYFAFALPQLISNGGIVDKFIGDAVMCLFTHTSVEEQTLRAVTAAVGMLRDLHFMNALGLPQTREPCHTGIGLNTGEAILGVIGTPVRMEATVLGNSVNLASRIESLCKHYNASLLISEHTLRGLGTKRSLFSIRFVDRVTVRGTSHPIEVFEVLDGDEDAVRSMKLSTLDMYRDAIEQYRAGAFAQAFQLLNRCKEASAGTDRVVQIYLDRCENLLSAGADGGPSATQQAALWGVPGALTQG